LETVARDILSEIIQTKRSEIKCLEPDKVLGFKSTIKIVPKTRSFLNAVSRPDRISIIAEIKKSSPSMGAIRPDVDVKAMARLYEDCGAAAISVLTDHKYFGGSVEDLIEVRKSVDIPILRKDFIIDANQILESRACGADAILLIVAALDDNQLLDFYQVASGLGMSSLIETHNAQEVERALKVNPRIIGINNRCLKTFKVDLSTSESLKRLIPEDVCVISESGIKDRSQALRLNKAGINAFLIGTSIIGAQDPERALRDLTGL
jgi:indole-3-glycerol phosphate synthase